MALNTKLDGKVAVVTGAASGIGRASARLLAERAVRVAVFDRSTSSRTSTTSPIRYGRS